MKEPTMLSRLVRPFGFRRSAYGVVDLLVALTVGLLCFAAGAYFVLGNLVDGGWPRVPASVLRIEKSANSGDGEAPIVAYEVTGTTFNVQASTPTSLRKVRTGDTVQVAYNPNSQGEAKVVHTGAAAIVPWILVIAGACVVVASVAAFRRVKDDELYDDEQDQTADDNTAPHPTRR